MPPLRTTSFITKPPAAPEVKPVDPVFILASIFLGISILSTGAAYGYGAYLNLEKENTITQIEILDNELSKYPLDEILDFNTKLKAVDSIISNQTYVTTILDLLSESTESDVFYTSFAFNSTPQGENTLVLSAVGRDYESIVRQLNTLRSDRYSKVVKSVKLDNMSTGNTSASRTFNLTLSVVPNIPTESINFEPRTVNGNLPRIEVPAPTPQVNPQDTNTSNTSNQENI